MRRYVSFSLVCLLALGTTVMIPASDSSAVDPGPLVEALARECNEQFEPTLVYSVDYKYAQQITKYELDSRRQIYEQFEKATSVPNPQVRQSSVPGEPGILLTPDQIQEFLKNLRSRLNVVPISEYSCSFVRNGEKFVFTTSTRHLESDGLTLIAERAPVSFLCDGKVLQVLHPNHRELSINPATANPELKQAKWQEFIMDYRSVPLPTYILSLKNVEVFDHEESLVLRSLTSLPNVTKPGTQFFNEETLTFSKALKLPTSIVSSAGEDKLHLRKQYERIYTYAKDDSGVSLRSCEENWYDSLPGHPNEVSNRNKITIQSCRRTAPSDISYYAPAIPDNYCVSDELTNQHFISGNSIKTIDQIIENDQEKK